MVKIILAELHKLWKHHTVYLKNIHYREDGSKPYKPRNNTTFEIGQTIMVKHHVPYVFECKYLMHYRVLKILNDSSLLLVTPNDTEHKTNMNDVKPATTPKLFENAWDLFLNTIKTNHQN